MAKVAILCILFIFISCKVKKQNTENITELKITLLTEEIDTAKKLADRYCSTCHLVPKPDELTAPAWQEVFSAMAPFLGFPRPDSSSSFWEYPNLPKPASPVITKIQWNLIQRYYLSGALKGLQPTRNKPTVCQKLFKPVNISYPSENSIISFVQIDKQCKCIWFADATVGQLFEANDKGIIQKTWPIEGAVTSMVRTRNGIFGVAAKNLLPNDEETGILFELEAKTVKILAQDLIRPVHISAKTTSHGTDELIVSEFGNYKGRLSLFSLEGKRKQEIASRSGFISTANIGPYTLALSAQYREAISLILTKDYKRKESILKYFSPTFGATSIQAFNQGETKNYFIVTNGDNGDLKSMPLKPYHGVRLFELNEQSIQERFFYPLYGAFKAVSDDYNSDGKDDIATIAYFFDKTTTEPEKATLLMNESTTEDFSFSACSLPHSEKGRFISLDSGDINDDGKADLVLGSAFTNQFDLGNLDGLNDPANRTSVLLLLNIR